MSRNLLWRIYDLSILIIDKSLMIAKSYIYIFIFKFKLEKVVFVYQIMLGNLVALHCSFIGFSLKLIHKQYTLLALQ